MDLHRVDQRQIAAEVTVDATGLHDRAGRNAVAGHDGVQALGTDHRLQPLAGNQRATVGRSQHDFADRTAFSLRLGQQCGQRHHIGDGDAAAEEDAIVLHVITHCHDVISCRDGANAHQPGQGQAQLRILHAFSLSTRNTRVERSTPQRGDLPQWNGS